MMKWFVIILVAAFGIMFWSQNYMDSYNPVAGPQAVADSFVSAALAGDEAKVRELSEGEAADVNVNASREIKGFQIDPGWKAAWQHVEASADFGFQATLDSPDRILSVEVNKAGEDKFKLHRVRIINL